MKPTHRHTNATLIFRRSFFLFAGAALTAALIACTGDSPEPGPTVAPLQTATPVEATPAEASHPSASPKHTTAHYPRQRLRPFHPRTDSYAKPESAAVRPVRKRYSRHLIDRKTVRGSRGLPRSAATPAAGVRRILAGGRGGRECRTGRRPHSEPAGPSRFRWRGSHRP